MKKASLAGRKKTSELSVQVGVLTSHKKEELLALKLETLNQAAKQAGEYKEIAVSQLIPDSNQPRKTFHHLDSLAQSIREKGLLQPLVVKPLTKDHYQIIVGERRFHAAQLAGLTLLPCIIRHEEDASILILQLLENDQREQVSPLDEAAALKRLLEEMKIPKQQIAKELGRDAAWISLRLGLNDAHPDIKTLAREDIIKDLRTLHELRQFQEEDPKAATVLIKKMLQQEVKGSYRDAVREARRRKPEKADTIKVVTQLQRDGERLLIYIGKKQPLTFYLNEKTWQSFLAS